MNLSSANTVARRRVSTSLLTTTALTAVAVLVLAASPAQAQFVWDAGGGSSDFTDGINWNPDGNPGVGDPVTVNNGGLPFQPVVATVETIDSLDLSAGSLTVSAGSLSAVNAINVSGGQLVTSGAGIINASSLNSTGGNVNATVNVTSFLLNGGTVDAGAVITASTTFDVRTGTVNGVLAGAGALTKTTGGTVTLAGANTYSGATAIDAGTVVASNAAALGTTAAGTTVANGANLTIAGVAIGAEAVQLNGGTALTGTGTASLAGTIDLAANSTVNVDGADALTLSGVVSGASDLTKIGTGTLTLSGANTYTGTTTISFGALVAGNADALGTTAGGTIVANGANLTIANVAVGAEAVQLNGGTALTGSGTASLAGNIDLAATSGVLVAGADNFTLSGIISGAGGLNKAAGGTLTLTGANTYTGTTQINSGTLVAGNVTALGTTAGGAIVANGGNLTIANVAIGAEAVQLNGGAALTGTGTASLAGTVDLAADSTVTVDSTDTLALSGVVSGANKLTKDGTGTLTLSGVNTHGSTSIARGTVVAANAGALSGGGVDVSNGGNLTIANVAIGAVAVQLNGGAALTGTGAASLAGTIDLAATSTVTVDGADTLTLSGVISGAGGLTKTGTSTLTLSAANIFTGVSNVNVGTLQILATGQLASATNVAAGATLTNAGTVAGVTNAGTFGNNGTAGATVNTGTVNNNATGTLASLTNNAGTANTTGNITGTATNAAGATLNVQGTIVGSVNNQGTFNVTNTLATGAFTNSGALNVNNGQHTTNGALTNSGALTVAAAGRLTVAPGNNLVNQLGGTITNNGRIDDDLNNAGTVVNNGIYNAIVATNTGTITNSATGTWNGNVASNANIINNVGTWNGSVLSNTGTINNTGAWIGSITNGGIWNARGGLTQVTGNFTNLAGGTIDMADADVTDVMTITGNLTGGGVVAMNIDVGATPAADVLKVNGTYTGNTEIKFTRVGNDISYKAADLLVVDLTGAQPGTFTAPTIYSDLKITPGGLVAYDLVKNGGGDWVVRVTPNIAAIGGIASNVSLVQSTIAAVVNRPSAPFVSGLAGQTDPVQCGAGPWMRATGGTARASGASSGVGITQNSSVDLGYAGAQFGMDLACFDRQQADNLIATSFGIIAGYNNGATKQEVAGVVNTVTDGKFEQGYIGLYGTYTNGGLRADLQARIDNSEFSFTNAAIGLNGTRLNNQRYSLNGSIGYAFTMDTMQIIPTAGFSLARTTGSSLTFAKGETLTLDASTSAVGFVGVTVAKTFVLPDQVSALIPFATATLYNDFADGPTSTFNQVGGAPLQIQSQNIGAFAEISTGVNFIRVLDGELGGAQQFNAGIRVDGKISDRLQSVGITGQARVQF